LFGWSSGASFAIYVLFRNPETFHNYLILSYAPDNQDSPLWKLEEDYYINNKRLTVKLFMGVGTYDPFYFNMLRFAQHIKEHNYKDLQIAFEAIENFEHSYETAVALMAKGLQFIFVKPSVFVTIMQLVEEQGADKAIQKFHQIKKTELENYSFNENDLNNLGYYLLNSQKFDAAIKIFKLNSEEYPKSANVYDSLVDAYMAAGDKGNAYKYLNKTLKLLEEYPDGVEKEKIRRLSEEKLIKIKNMK
jgi:tetratricopeptide (TPR) repeat protein